MKPKFTNRRKRKYLPLHLSVRLSACVAICVVAQSEAYADTTNTVNETNLVGALGIAGIAGGVGSSGANGIHGAAGANGAPGTAGRNGDAGIAGIDGATGLPGIEGARGIDGTPGTDQSLNPGVVGGTGGIGGPGGDAGNGFLGGNGTNGGNGGNGEVGGRGGDGLNGVNGGNGGHGQNGLKGLNGQAGGIGFAVAESSTLTNRATITGGRGGQGGSGGQGGNGGNGGNGGTGGIGGVGGNGGSGGNGGRGGNGGTGGRGGHSGRGGTGGTGGAGGAEANGGTGGKGGLAGDAGDGGNGGNAAIGGNGGNGALGGNGGNGGNGGIAGRGGNAGDGGDGGNGGNGGVGVTLASESVLVNEGTIHGGAGGMGGAGGLAGDAGNAGTHGAAGTAGAPGENGSAGIGAVSGSAGLGGLPGETNRGGGGGGGGHGGDGADGGEPGMRGGPGNPGISGLDGNPAAVARGTDGSSPTAAAIGGTGGLSGLAVATASGIDGSAAAMRGAPGSIGDIGIIGLGGVGVYGNGDSTVINRGTIAGGWNGNNTIQANAIEFANGGNRLEIQAGSQIIGNVVASTTGEADILALGGSANGTFDMGAIGDQYVGFGGLEKTGGSTWTLTGIPDEDLPWYLNGGSLAVDNDASLGSPDNPLNFNGGTLQVLGDDFTGTTRPIITTGPGGATFNITDPANCFEINTPITGNGGLVKTGVGTLILNGVHTYTGLTDITAGTLAIGGSPSQASSSIAGSAIVRSNGTLAGCGTILGNLTNHGTVAPGGVCNDDHPIAAITVGGNYTQGTGGVLQIDIDRNTGSHDQLLVGGTATLGGDLEIITQDGSGWYQAGNIVVATGGVTGTFADITTNISNLDAVGIYTPTTGGVQLFRNDVIFAQIPGLTPNQQATAGGVDSLPNDDGLYRNILIEGQPNIRRTLDQLSGELHAASAMGSLANERVIRDANLSNIRRQVTRADRGAAPAQAAAPTYLNTGDSKGGMYEAPPAATPSAGGLTIWGAIASDELSIDSTPNNFGIDSDLLGVVAGVNATLGEDWHGGLAFGYTSADVALNNGFSSSSDVETYSLTATLGRSFELNGGMLNLLMGASYGNGDVSTSRNISVGLLRETLRSSYDTSAYQFFGELGYAIELDSQSVLEPFLTLSTTSISGDSYKETGGLAALSGNGFELDQSSSVLGLRYKRDMELGSLPVEFRVSAGWERLYGDLGAETSHKFAGGSAFTVSSAEMSRDAAIVNIGTLLEITDDAFIDASYTGRFAEQNNENTFQLMLGLEF